MNIFLFLLLFSFVVIIILGVYAFKLDPKSQLNRIFLGVCLCVAFWSIFDIFSFYAPSKEICWLWYKFSSFGWCIIPGMGLHFFLVLTNKETLLKKWWIYPALYLPGILLIYKVFTGTVMVKDFILKDFGWSEVSATDSVWYWFFIAYLCYLAVGVFITRQWGNKSRIIREKKQAKTIVLTTIIAIIFGSLRGIIFPAFEMHILPSSLLDIIVTLIWTVGIWYSIVKYKLMIFTPAIAFNEVISKIVDLLVIVSPEGNIIKVNRQIEELLEYKEEELLGKPLSKIVQEEKNKKVIARIKESLYIFCNYELTYKTKYGDYIPVNINSSTIKDETGDLVGVVIVGQDMRQTKQLQKEIAERKLAEEALRASEEKYRMVVENANEAIFVAQDGRFMFVNPKAEEILGYPKEDLLSRPFAKFIYPDDQEIFAIRDQGRLNGEELPHIYTFRIVDQESSIRWVEINSVLVTWEERPATLNFLSDITERKQAEIKLKYLSLHDPLTGLYNRAFFEQEMRRLEEESRAPAGIIMCDVNGLKLINDTLGHTTGDTLLMAAAGVISESFREGDIVARIGGDEFAILLPSGGRAAVEGASHRIRDAIARYNAVNLELPVSISIGFATSSESSINMDDVFKEADNNMYREKLHSSQSTRSAIVQTLMKALKARDFITEGHADRMQDLSAELAMAMGLPERRVIDLRLLARFHDIGKVGIPDRILFKPGPLTPGEAIEMQRHCEIGYRIAQSSPDLVPIADWILKHHEWWNNKGYPLGLKGEEIPLECRILAIVDAYDAMTSDRPYRKAMSQEKAMAELRRCSGTQFEPKLVQLFLQVLRSARKSSGNVIPL
ncbi:MAG: PAS domain S-box protein [Eubacteriales bacterium]